MPPGGNGNGSPAKSGIRSGMQIGRRDFLAAAAGLTAAAITARVAPAAPASGSTVARRVGSGGVGNEKLRLENLAAANRLIRRCLVKHQTLGYLPGQAIYNLGEYPAARPWEITDADEARLDELAANGIELVQVHEEWNDAQRLFGGDKFSPTNDAGFRRFIAACHRRRLKIIPYISTGYIERRDPDFQPGWARKGGDLVELWYQYARCSPASASWRSYLLPRVRHLLEEYGVDGLYNDVGYRSLHDTMPLKTDDEVMAFEESPAGQGAFEDLLGVIYDEVKRRGGVVKVHAGHWYRGGRKPPEDRRLFDYLWVGESADGLDRQREQLRTHPTYVVPCPYYARLEKVDPAEAYLHTLPYMQFPILMGGKPFTGERGAAPNVTYKKESPGKWTQLKHLANVREYYQRNPTSLRQTYGWWDAVGGGQDRRLHFRLLGHYRRMVQPGSWAYLEITDSELFERPPSAGVVASAFVNDTFFVVLANYNPAAVELSLRDRYHDVQQPSVLIEPRSPLRLPPRSLTILAKARPN